MRLGTFVLGTALAIVPAVTCRATEPIKVVAAENFYGNLAEQIGGKHVAVTSILANPDADPHLFESSASTARALNDAAIVIYNGAEYDPWMKKLLSASQVDSRRVIVAAQLLGIEPGANPHLWYDPATLPAVATAFATDLERIDPADAADYKANLASFVASFAPIWTEVAQIKARYGGTSVTATEPVFGYMEHALGFDVLNYGFQLAIMNDAEPSASQTADFENSLRSRKAKILFYNSQVTDKTTQRLLQIARDSNIPVIGVTETEPPNTPLQAWFAHQVQEVQNALLREPR